MEKRHTCTKCKKKRFEKYMKLTNYQYLPSYSLGDRSPLLFWDCKECPSCQATKT